jgi:Cu-Zn family superoxide dismutase
LQWQEQDRPDGWKPKTKLEIQLLCNSMKTNPQNPSLSVVLTIVALICAAGIGFAGYALGLRREKDAARQTAEPAAVRQAVAVLRPAGGSGASGVVTFEETDEGVRISGEVRGLEPGAHGFHIHEYGDLRAADGSSAGGHFSPRDRAHGAPDEKESHLGDLGNIEADASGLATIDLLDADLALEGVDSILGRGLVVHAAPDDMATQPSGAAGPRLAVGVIGVAASPEMK